MDFPAIKHLLRRSRLRSFAAGSHAVVSNEEIIKPVEYTPDSPGYLDPRFYASLNDYSPAELSSIQAASSAAAAKAAAAVKTSSSSSVRTVVSSSASATRAAAQPATQGLSRASSVAQATTAITTSSSTSSSSSLIPSSSSSSIRSSSVTSISTSSSARISSTSSPTVITITSTRASSSSTIPSQIATVSNSTSIANSKTDDDTSSLSTGSIVGIVLALLVGLIVIGSFFGWCYRKRAGKSHNTPWSQLPDEVTPFPEKGDDIYGTSSAPVIGSRRALALARDNSFNPDGTLRPDSEIMIERNNRAGFGAGNYGGYPEPVSSPLSSNAYGVSPNSYGVDPLGRPYNAQAGRTPMIHTYNDYGEPSPPSSRQLLGPSPQQATFMPAPVPMGRPGVPTTQEDLIDHEGFSDYPDNDNDRYDEYMPRTAASMGEWAGHAQPSIPMPMPLPALTPLSPMMTTFDLRRTSQLPAPPATAAAKYEDEKSRQKRMYGEVARAAGVDEPITPGKSTSSHSYPHPHPNQLDQSTSSTMTSSSFSAHDPNSTSLVSSRLPTLQVIPPPPFEHGRPLSTLEEVNTPISITSINITPAQPSSSLLHHEVNPFDERLAAIGTAISPPSPSSPAAPPYTASSAGATMFPSPRFPPPSPGGMSVPGSITDSPGRWERRDTRYDEDDAYGGI